MIVVNFSKPGFPHVNGDDNSTLWGPVGFSEVDYPCKELSIMYSFIRKSCVLITCTVPGPILRARIHQGIKAEKNHSPLCTTAELYLCGVESDATKKITV